MANINLEDEGTECVGYETKERLKKPTLFVAALKDPVARADIHEAAMKAWAEDLRIERIPSSAGALNLLGTGIRPRPRVPKD